MGELDDEELQRAFRMSLQPVPDAKRSKPRDNVTLSSSPAATSTPSETAEARNRRLQREVLAAAAEQRKTMIQGALVGAIDSSMSPDRLSHEHVNENSGSSRVAGSFQERILSSSVLQTSAREYNERSARGKRRVDDERQYLSYRTAEQLYTMVFGTNFGKDVLAQWCNQGFRFSQDLETSIGLVQREGGPCGVLAPIQAIVLKYLLFVPEDEVDAQLWKKILHMSSSTGRASNPNTRWCGEADPNLTFTDVQITRALVRALGETLWRAGGKTRAVLVVLDIPGLVGEDVSREDDQDRIVAKALDGVALDSVKEFHRLVRVYAVQSTATLLLQLHNLLPAFRSRMGALLLLFSALLSRGLDAVQNDRDDPEQPLVTPPFGHASQEIVNLLLCGQAVPNVFDGSMDLGGGMCLKGIPTSVEVGFLTLLESLNLCKVGQRLKRPVWPIWVLGSESHYTVLFALSTDVQGESGVEDIEARIRQAFDAQDQSGGGGFITLEALHRILSDQNIVMPADMVSDLCSSDIVVWSDFWQSLRQLDISKGGLKDNSPNLGHRYFELLHFNGIAKTVATVGDAVLQRPRLSKLSVSAPPKWTPDTTLVEEVTNAAPKSTSASSAPPQHAPLVDCIRTRWPQASCNWSGDVPSIV